MDSLPAADLVSVRDKINKTIDFEESKNRRRTSVKAGVDRNLDERKRLYAGMDDLLKIFINEVKTKLPEWAHRYILSCTYYPQIGFVTEVETDPVTGNGRYEGEGAEGGPWEKHFSANGSAYYKNDDMRRVDEEIGDMLGQIGGKIPALPWCTLY